MERPPSAFVAQDLALPARLNGAAGEARAALGRSLKNATAVLVASAQWETDRPMLSGTMRQPTSLHVAQRARNLLRIAGFAAGIDGRRGSARAAWRPLLDSFPGIDLPMVELSVQPPLGPVHHVSVGKALHALREEGVLILGSGGLADEDFLPFFVALGAAGEGAKPERFGGIESLQTYLFQ